MAKPDLRLRGRAGVQQRKRRLASEPLCRHCKERGFVTVAEEVDHIIPLQHGGSDTDDNVQCLCKPCHEIKTAYEDVAHSAAANHPDWLTPSAIPIAIVSGPPCSGKTTYVQQHAKPGDTVIDIDDIARTLDPSYVHWAKDVDRALLNRSIRVRNAMLGSLARAKHGKAWFIVSAPTQAERDWWQSKLGGEVILLHPGVEECKRRAVARGTPIAIDGVDKWERKAAKPWAPKGSRQSFSADGRVVW